MRAPTRRLFVVAAAVIVVAAACGGDDEATAIESAQEATTSTLADPSPTELQPVEPDVESVTDVSADWSVQRIGAGIKPSLALNDGGAAIAYLTEALEGGVFYASAADDWQVEEVAAGYFYGPIDLAFDADTQPNVVYHDHQGTGFDPDLGDLTLARREGSDWSLIPSGDPGHDGWDSTIRFGPSGELWAAGIEPLDFGTSTGVEFYELDGSEWSVVPVGGPPITYQFNVSMATSTDGQPVLSYYDDGTDTLHVATRTTSGWTDEIVPTEGGGGQFSSLVIDPAGTRHVTFYSPSSSTGGVVAYAFDDGSGWQVEPVRSLDDVAIGMTGARRITSLQVLADGTPVVATTDKSAVWLSTRGADGWATELVLAAGSRPLGQQIQFVAADDGWHLATFEVTSPSPLEGEIIYLQRAG